MDELEAMLGSTPTEGAYLDVLDKFPATTVSFLEDQKHQREVYGISLSDLQNPLQYINFLYASYFRQIDTIEGNILLDCLINVNEYLLENTVAGYENMTQLRVLSLLHLQEFGELYVEAVKLWPKLYQEVVVPADKLDEFQLIQIVDKLIVGVDKKWLWEDIRGVLPDPTEVSASQYPTHIKERGEQGYSQYDALHFPDYIHWVVMQTVLFLLSDNAHGTPMRYAEKPFYWDEILRAFLEGMLYGTYAEYLSQEQKAIYETSILNMLDIYPDFVQ